MHLNSSGSNYREWVTLHRSTYAHSYAEEDDLVARSYIKLIIHKYQLKYVSKTQTKYDTWQALKDIHEGASTTDLLTLMTEISNPRWTSDVAF
ncbi:hypothetical protein DYB28_009557 [Aphanomyces astaci]|uniref:Uncharacterized protein n=1 Tax=Aphanomyces astaci TaxID=112090 RepID=A0A3L6VDT6_APHAT|nr:hypothetical protein DYB34_010517 [Aphanomyces astaci]RLO07035.1 hypothetical protein DYB28_009557 [Aphanomyces astaci]